MRAILIWMKGIWINMFKKNRNELSKLWVFKKDDNPIDKKAIKYAKIRTIREVNASNKSSNELVEMVKFAISNWGHVTFQGIPQEIVIDIYKELTDDERAFYLIDEYTVRNGKERFTGWYSIKVI